MRSSLIGATLIMLIAPQAVPAQEVTVARPELLLREAVEGMPKGDRQEVRVLTATIKPGGKTVFHTHRFPVTVYILEGDHA
jgi:quercetin dioxygenase-like cupin family protein